MQNSHNTCGDI